MPDCSVRYLAGLEAESAVALVLTATAAAAISATKMRTTRFITGRTRVAAVFVARTGCLRRFYAPCRDSFTPGAKKRRPGRCDRAANVSSDRNVSADCRDGQASLFLDLPQFPQSP